MCRECRRAVSSLAAPAKKSVLLVFKHQRLPRRRGRGGGLFSLAAPGSDVRPWQVLSADSSATERAVGFRSHYAICFSHLLLFSADICSRGLCGWRGCFLRGEEEEEDARPCPHLQETPNQTEMKLFQSVCS